MTDRAHALNGERMKLFEEGILDFIAQRRAEQGIEESGLLAYYAQRVDKQRALTRYERELLDYLAGERRIVHAGIGIGPLTAGLALQGSQVLAFEADDRRHAAATALKASIAPDTDYEIRRAFFPDGLQVGDETADATLLFTNVANCWPEPTYEGAILAMHRFRRTILDLRLFGHTRNDAQERQALACRLEDARLSLEPLPFRAANSYYVELRPA